ncbi:prion-inhibition and propagation-domain-containing protein [Tricladium varicosporioides]|nr:prion-inhibition and propagation-domain-containing protein [Hymenoscyphus varicosporioides]
MASITTLLRDCLQNLKAILTSKDFGANYELLCTELTLQWMRIRLWGESVGVNVEELGQHQNYAFSRADVQSTVSQAVVNIASLLAEIEIIRNRYEFKPNAKASRKDSKRSIRGISKGIKFRKSTAPLDSPSPATTLQLKITENQRQKSFFTLAKWARSDAKKFKEKIQRLKNLIDALEDITRSVENTGVAAVEPPNYDTAVPSEDPPPYIPGDSASCGVTSATLPTTQSTTPAPVFTQHNQTFSQQYKAFKICLTGRPENASGTIHARDKLLGLSERQFKELRADVYDELIRREEYSHLVAHALEAKPNYHPKRNQARRKLSTLAPHRFQDLVADIVFEIERRFAFFPEQFGYTDREVSQSPSSSQTPLTPGPNRHRYGYVGPQISAENLRCISRPLPTLSEEWPLRSNYPANFLAPRQSSPSTQSIDTNPSILKSFHVKTNSTTLDVLPAALATYGIPASSCQEYCLYIIFGDQERCMGLYEKPLKTFKELHNRGLKPHYLLKKLTPEAKMEQKAADEAGGWGLVADRDTIFF